MRGLPRCLCRVRIVRGVDERFRSSELPFESVQCEAVKLRFRMLVRGDVHLLLIVAIEPFDFRSSPGCSSQKFKARLNARIVRETANGHFHAHRFPTHIGHKLFQHHFKCDAVQRIERTPSRHFMRAEESWRVCDNTRRSCKRQQLIRRIAPSD